MNYPEIDQLEQYQIFRNFIIDQDHPCVMAQSVFKLDHVQLYKYSGFGTVQAAISILNDIKEYLAQYDFNSNDFYSFLAVFDDVPELTEEKFEKLLWQQLNYLHQVDDTHWDKQVSKDPESNEFSFSIGGKAFYIVGLHPNSSRKARQSPQTAIAFNLHRQFEKLREMGTYKRVRNTIRQRDINFHGSINPMLKDHGKDSEARQYSGRAVSEAWKCPFMVKD